METHDPTGVYTLKEWLSDYTWFCQETHKYAPDSASMGREEFEAYFLRTRGNPSLANHCLERFVRAVSFLEANIRALDFGKAAVAGEGQFMVSKAVVITLYRFFVAIPDADIDVEVPLDQFLEQVKYELGL
jgi:hypothetical protein